MSGPSDKRNKTMGVEVSCTGKVAFDSYKLAAAVVNRVNVKERPGRSAYQCGYCNQWHIGSDKGRVQAKKSKEYRERKNYE